MSPQGSIGLTCINKWWTNVILAESYPQHKVQALMDLLRSYETVHIVTYNVWQLTSFNSVAFHVLNTEKNLMRKNNLCILSTNVSPFLISSCFKFKQYKPLSHVCCKALLSIQHKFFFYSTDHKCYVLFKNSLTLLIHIL